MRLSPKLLDSALLSQFETATFVFGGIGADKDSAIDPEGNPVPLCAHGYDDVVPGLSNALYDAGVGRCASDDVVIAINKEHGAGRLDRVSFQDWCKEARVFPDTRWNRFRVRFGWL